MGNQETRDRLIQATKHLLREGTQLESLTARKLSTEAGTNLAMINYCFKSKDELLKIAVDEIISEEFYDYAGEEEKEEPPKSRLEALLMHISGVMIKYHSLTKLSIPYLMLNDEITLPLDLLPYIRSHYGETRSEEECRVIAFQIVYSMQLIFYRADDFRKYSGIDIRNEIQMQKLLRFMLDTYLPDGKPDKNIENQN